jgi:hypothetical protein
MSNKDEVIINVSMPEEYGIWQGITLLPDEHGQIPLKSVLNGMAILTEAVINTLKYHGQLADIQDTDLKLLPTQEK